MLWLGHQRNRLRSLMLKLRNMTTQGIRITKANDFSRVQLARSRQEP